jgi:hypothetical protein
MVKYKWAIHVALGLQKGKVIIIIIIIMIMDLSPFVLPWSHFGREK